MKKIFIENFIVQIVQNIFKRSLADHLNLSVRAFLVDHINELKEVNAEGTEIMVRKMILVAAGKLDPKELQMTEELRNEMDKYNAALVKQMKEDEERSEVS